MNNDIRLSVEFFDHPKTVKLQRRLGVGAVICLQRLWIWTAQNRSNGVLSGIDCEDVEIAAKWDGEPGEFCQTLVDLRFIDETDGVYALHDWCEHQEYASKEEERKDRARRAADARWGNKNASGMPKNENSNANDSSDLCLHYANSILDASLSNAPNQTKPSLEEDTTPDGVVVDAEDADASQPGEKRQAHASPACPYDAIVGLYHEAFPEHPRVAIVNAKRKGAMKARWTEAGERLRMLNRDTSAAERLDYFRRLFARASRSDFLTGKKAFRDGTVYRVDFDKLMSPSGFMGVIEGKYDNREVA